MDAAVIAERQEADGLAGQAQRDFPMLSISAGGRSDREDQSDPAWLGKVLRDRPLESVFLLYPKLGGDEDSASSGSGVPASRLRLEAVEQGMAVGWDSSQSTGYRIKRRSRQSLRSDRSHNPSCEVCRSA